MIKETEHFIINDLDKYFKKTCTRPQQYLKWLKRKTTIRFFCLTRHYRFGIGYFRSIKFYDEMDDKEFGVVFVDSPLILKGRKSPLTAAVLSSMLWEYNELRNEAIHILEEYIKDKN